MTRWRTYTPPAPGVYRVAEPRALEWYALWNGRHWCQGADNPREAAAQSDWRAPPSAWTTWNGVHLRRARSMMPIGRERLAVALGTSEASAQRLLDRIRPPVPATAPATLAACWFGTVPKRLHGPDKGQWTEDEADPSDGTMAES